MSAPRSHGKARPVPGLLGALAAITALAGLGVAACGADPAQDLGPGSTFVERRLTWTGGEAIDLLLVVDDSGSMEKRPHLAQSAAEMVRRLVAPPCVDERGVEIVPGARATPGGACPQGTAAAWAPVEDLGVGIITTSLGAAGRGDRCVGDDGGPVSRGDSRARLMARSSPGGIDDVPTWQGRGFLAWDPAGTRRCDTRPDAYCAGLGDADELVARVQTIVAGLGAGGCGDEAPLEAAWRFLGDPTPPIGVDEAGRPRGLDEELLAQRAAFLRPGSRLVVALVTDEDDCSFRIDEVGRYGTDAGSPMPRPREECAGDPGHPCCVSCIEATPVGCRGTGGCQLPGCQDPAACPENFHADADQNDRRWRCVDSKRRFGLDLLYPPARYVSGFTQWLINPRRLDLAPDGSEDDVENRLVAEHEVHLLMIGPVDWEVLARRNAVGDPDLVHGLDPEGTPRGGYQSVDELRSSGAWDPLVADVAGNDAPIRLLTVAGELGSGWDDGAVATLASIQPPRTEGDPPRALDVGFEAAASELAGRSTCGPWRRLPGGVPGDGCGSTCMAVQLEAEVDGSVACHLLEARDSDGDGDPSTATLCGCDPGEARLEPDGDTARYADWIRERMLAEDVPPGYDCLCVIPQVAGDGRDPASPRHACQHDELPGPGVDGWCYVDPGTGSGNPDLLTTCHPNERRLVRLVGRGQLGGEGRLHIACASR